jgi:hypothetical protein
MAAGDENPLYIGKKYAKMITTADNGGNDKESSFFRVPQTRPNRS